MAKFTGRLSRLVMALFYIAMMTADINGVQASREPFGGVSVDFPEFPDGGKVLGVSVEVSDWIKAVQIILKVSQPVIASGRGDAKVYLDASNPAFKPRYRRMTQRQIASELINAGCLDNAIKSGMAGLAPIPGAALLGSIAVSAYAQVRLVSAIATVYGYDVSAPKTIGMLATVLSSEAVVEILAKNVATSIFAGLPIIGGFVNFFVDGAACAAIANAYTDHSFE